VPGNVIKTPSAAITLFPITNRATLGFISTPTENISGNDKELEEFSVENFWKIFG